MRAASKGGGEQDKDVRTKYDDAGGGDSAADNVVEATFNHVRWFKNVEKTELRICADAATWDEVEACKHDRVKTMSLSVIAVKHAQMEYVRTVDLPRNLDDATTALHFSCAALHIAEQNAARNSTTTVVPSRPSGISGPTSK